MLKQMCDDRGSVRSSQMLQIIYILKYHYPVKYELRKLKIRHLCRYVFCLCRSVVRSLGRSVAQSLLPFSKKVQWKKHVILIRAKRKDRHINLPQALQTLDSNSRASMIVVIPLHDQICTTDFCSTEQIFEENKTITAQRMITYGTMRCKSNRNCDAYVMAFESSLSTFFNGFHAVFFLSILYVWLNDRKKTQKKQQQQRQHSQTHIICNCAALFRLISWNEDARSAFKSKRTKQVIILICICVFTDASWEAGRQTEVRRTPKPNRYKTSQCAEKKAATTSEYQIITLIEIVA